MADRYYVPSAATRLQRRRGQREDEDLRRERASQLLPYIPLARRIAEDLFTNGAGERATRLVLMKDGRDLGGWGLEPITYRIARVLLRLEMESP